MKRKPDSRVEYIRRQGEITRRHAADARWLYDATAAAAESGFQRMCRHPEPVYLFWKPGVISAAPLSHAAGDVMYESMTRDTERLPTNLTLPQLKAYVLQRIRDLRAEVYPR